MSMQRKLKRANERNALKPSAIISPDEQIFFAVAKAKLAFDVLIEFERMIHRLARRCDKIDVALSMQPDTKKLQDALSGGLRQAIEDDYNDIVDVWKDAREYYLYRQDRDLGEFGTTYQQGLKKMVDDRLAALDALAKGDDSLIRALPPLDHDTDKLLNPVAKSGRKSGVSEWKLYLRDEWKKHEGDANTIRHAILESIGIPDTRPNGSKTGTYTMRDSLSDAQREAFKRLTSATAIKRPEQFERNLFNDPA